MGLEPDARLVINEDVDLRSLPLTPSDFFVYSRIRSLGTTKPTVADIVAVSGQSEAAAGASIAKLLELGALELVKAVDTNPEQVASQRRERTRSTASRNAGPALMGGTEMRERARTRRRELLAAQLRAVRSSGGSPSEDTGEGTEAAPEGDAPLPVSRPFVEDGQPAENAGPRSILNEVQPVADNDPRLIAESKVPIERQRRLLALRDRLRHVGHFQLLGIDPVDDPKPIRRAYHVISREFHPDSFYGKELGSFGGVLDDLFRRARASYEFLLDADQRRPLVEAFEAERRAKQAAQERLASIAHEEETREAREAQRVKLERDRERQDRIKGRALDLRRKQAAKHANQAKRELAQGRHGTAATLFRLAHEQDPNNTEYEEAWRESLATARRKRGEISHKKALVAKQAGNHREAARHFASAADADPTLRHLGEAADAMADYEPKRARKYAIGALEALRRSQSDGLPLEEKVVAEVHVACARAFVSADEPARAREQAEHAHALAPTKQTQTLLNSIKVP